MSQQINLYEAALRKQEKPFSAATMAVALAVIAAAFLAAHGYLVSQLRGIERTLKESEKVVATLREQATRSALQTGAEAGGQLLGDELARSEARLKARRELLRDITTGVSVNTEGYSGLMTGFARRAIPGVWLTGFSVGGDNRLDIKGRVLDTKLVPAYMQALRGEEFARGRNVAELTLKAHEEAAKPQPAQKSDTPPSRPLRYVEFLVSLTPKDATTTENKP